MRLALLVAALAVAALGGPAGAGVIDRARETGTLRLAYRTDAAPFSYADAGGAPAGYSVDLCKSVVEAVRAAAGRPDIEPEWRAIPAEDRFDAMAGGELDLACGADTVTLGRRERVDFSLLTFVSGVSLLYRADGPSSFEALKGQKVGVRQGSTTEANLGDGLSRAGIDAQVIPVGSHDEGIARLAAGEFAAYVGDGAILLYQAMRSPDRQRLKLAERPLSFEPYALPLPKGDADFRLLVDRTLARLYRSGQIQRVFAAAFGDQARPSGLVEALYALNALREE